MPNGSFELAEKFAAAKAEIDRRINTVEAILDILMLSRDCLDKTEFQRFGFQAGTDKRITVVVERRLGGFFWRILMRNQRYPSFIRSFKGSRRDLIRRKLLNATADEIEAIRTAFFETGEFKFNFSYPKKV